MAGKEKLSNYVAFRNDLFFGGAAQISWFETDPEQRNLAASSFVFHGPKYHGVGSEDVKAESDYRLTDSVSFTWEVVKVLDSGVTWDPPIALAIGGYGSGKSHMGLTLATLLSNPTSKVSSSILSNINKAEAKLGLDIDYMVSKWERPFLVLALNGMNDFDLANELSRQALLQIRNAGLDSVALDDLWPRFTIAQEFSGRNFGIWKDEFIKRFGDEITLDLILAKLSEHDEFTYSKINSIFETVNGTPIRAVSQESPQQLIKTLCDHYCGKTNYFKGLVILFDEFGRYVTFAADKPHIAGDAALQQLFEGVQDNSDKSFLLCFIQYELQVYLARVASERQVTIQRYVSRYDVAKKFYLSCNLETLFANLIEKKNESAISKLIDSSGKGEEINSMQFMINKWLPSSKQFQVWQDPGLFHRIISIGCWPINPMGVWFLARLDNLLQSRSSITFVREAIDREKNKPVNNSTWPIAATDICSEALIHELIAAEDYGQRGSSAQAFSTVEQKYRSDLSELERNVLKAVLLANKMSIRAQDMDEFIKALSFMSGINADLIKTALKELTRQYGVVEWDDRFKRFEILAYAVPRSAFIQLLKKKTQKISELQAEEIFATHIKKWADLANIDPGFALENAISTSDWLFETRCCSSNTLNRAVESSLVEWKNAVKPDALKGKLLYCYVAPNQKLEEAMEECRRKINDAIKATNCPETVPLMIVLLHDSTGELLQLITELFVIENSLDQKETDQFRHFIEDYKEDVLELIRSSLDRLKQGRHYVLPNPIKPQSIRIKNMAKKLFDSCYPRTLPFRFDGFSTAKGSAAKDCRDISAELFQGTLDDEWISSRPPHLMNRSHELLKKGADSWGILGTDGKPSRYPSSSKLREIFSDLDDRLKAKGYVNLGEICDELMAPPYGLNIASAGLVLGAFVCPRVESVSFVLDQDSIAPAHWVGQVFSGNFLDLAKLRLSEIRHVSETESSEWEDLLAKWDVEETHAGKIAFLSEANSLCKRIPIPSGILQERLRRLTADADKSRAEQEAFESFMAKEDHYFQKALASKDVGNLSRVGSDMRGKLEGLRSESHKWDPRQIKLLSEVIDRVAQLVMAHFHGWLQQENCTEPTALAAWRHKMGLIVDNLKSLHLDDLARELTEHIQMVADKIEEEQKIRYEREEVMAFLGARQLSRQTRVADLCTWRDESQQHLVTLVKARTPKTKTTIDSIMREVEAFNSRCKDQIEACKERLTKLFDRKFSNIQELTLVQVEVKELSDLFAGRDGDSEDLSNMQAQLRDFNNCLSTWGDLSIDNETLRTMVSKKIMEIESDDGDLPWDSESIYRSILENLLAERKRKSEDWLERLQASSAKVKTMKADECASLLNSIATIPAYADPSHVAVAKSIQKKAEKRIDDLAVEGMLARFRRLSKTLQEEFLKLASKELGKSKP